MAEAESNTLYYGDNLDVLRRYFKDETVDLVYLDPPFNSNANYNALFGEQDGTKSHAQVMAFEDTWEWDTVAAATYQETVEQGGRVADVLRAFRTFLGTNDVRHGSAMLAYVSMMAPRLVELRQVLKPTGSLYLHCDPTASHYLKILLDAVFGGDNFRNEITWKRTFSHGNVGRNFGAVCDTIFFYSKSNAYTWNQQFAPYSEEYIEGYFRYRDDDGRRYRTVTLRNPSPRPNLRYDYTASNGVTYKPHPNGWAVGPERMKKYDDEGLLYYPKKDGGALLIKQYLDSKEGVKLQNLWDDIPPIGAHAAERLGYPTQKPEQLLERIIATSSNEGDLVLDPFCGCGTAVVSAERLGRRWAGIDITHLSINLMKHRLLTAFGEDIKFKTLGEPTDVEGARQLAQDDKYQFQWWALGLVGARPVEQKKGADGGVDGRLYFHDDQGADTKQVVFSVKAGKNLHVDMVRDLRGVVERDEAAMGVLISMEPPTKPMREEAASAGFYESGWGPKYQRVQLITVGELLDGKQLDTPGVLAKNVTLKRAPKAKKKVTKKKATNGGVENESML